MIAGGARIDGQHHERDQHPRDPVTRNSHQVPASPCRTSRSWPAMEACMRPPPAAKSSAPTTQLPAGALPMISRSVRVASCVCGKTSGGHALVARMVGLRRAAAHRLAPVLASGRLGAASDDDLHRPYHLADQDAERGAADDVEREVGAHVDARRARPASRARTARTATDAVGAARPRWRGRTPRRCGPTRSRTRRLRCLGRRPPALRRRGGLVQRVLDHLRGPPGEDRRHDEDHRQRRPTGARARRSPRPRRRRRSHRAA